MLNDTETDEVYISAIMFELQHGLKVGVPNVVYGINISIVFSNDLFQISFIIRYLHNINNLVFREGFENIHCMPELRMK